MIKIQDMPPQQQTVMILVGLALLAICVMAFLEPRNSDGHWQHLALVVPGFVIGYPLGMWVGSNNKKK